MLSNPLANLTFPHQALSLSVELGCGAAMSIAAMQAAGMSKENVADILQ